MTIDEMIIVLKDGRINAYESAAIQAKLKAAEGMYLALKGWNEPFFEAWIKAYEEAGQSPRRFSDEG